MFVLHKICGYNIIYYVVNSISQLVSAPVRNVTNQINIILRADRSHALHSRV